MWYILVILACGVGNGTSCAMIRAEFSTQKECEAARETIRADSGSQHPKTYCLASSVRP